MFVITVLIAILMPTLGTAQEAARRTVCLSNVRQVGFGLSSFADERRGLLPPSIYKQDVGPGLVPSGASPEMMRLRIGIEEAVGRGVAPSWDGLGLLHEGGFLQGPKVYYCPSHRGEHRFSEYAQVWGSTDKLEIIGNYQYRGSDRNGNRRLFQMEPLKTALVSDGMRTLSDYSHRVGCNLLRADLSVEWLGDRQYRIADLLKVGTDERTVVGDSALNLAWSRMDTPAQQD
ncbi:MAG: hypothetical protein AABZ53_08750 [Planctomycetota bacterium]|mgnify:CR=1 FL=1